MAVPSLVIRCYTPFFSAGLIATQFETSKIVLPHPLHTSSNKVEHMPMQGESTFSGAFPLKSLLIDGFLIELTRFCNHLDPPQRR
jgi:hypothetical protein